MHFGYKFLPSHMFEILKIKCGVDEKGGQKRSCIVSQSENKEEKFNV